jgi:adenylate cyclase
MREERRVLQRVGMPPNVRLACQIRPQQDISVVPLLPATASAPDGFARPAHVAGQEREIAVLFGADTEPDDGARRALVAAGEIIRGVDHLSQRLAEELEEPLRVGIGIHTGPTIVGQMGYGAAVYLTAVGDTVHVAGRLQELTKQCDCQLVISEQVAVRAGVDISRLVRHELTVRNRSALVVVYVIDDVGTLRSPT